MPLFPLPKRNRQLTSKSRRLLPACCLTLCLIASSIVSSSCLAEDPGEDQRLADPRPNVVIFLSDDQGFGDFSFTGNRDLQTPNIDSLATDGAFIKHFYVCPVCSPTRAEFLTGRYHLRGGVYSTSAGGERLDLDEATIAESFQAAGYRTGAFGKWHNGMQPPYHPNARGFDQFYGFCSGHWGHYFSPMLEHNNEMTRGKGFVIDDFTSQAIKFMEANRDRPFFVYLPYCTPHSPMQVPDKYWERHRDQTISQPSSNRKREVINHTRAALAMCENIDDNVGRVLEKLEQLGVAENTIVMYFCDNGPNGWRYNLGLKGKKGSTDEGGVRSPLFVRWPAKIAAGTRPTQTAGAIDLFPTLVDLCGIKATNKKPFDGVSVAGDLLGKPSTRSRMIFSHWNKKLAVRDGRHVLNHENKLFDLLNDPNQTTPLNDHQEAKQRLMDAATKFREELMVKLDRSQQPFTLGHPDFAKTQLPARDGTATGQIIRSSRHPNCSFFGNWVDTADKITWPVEVLQAGRYQVDLYYCCRERDLGTELALTIADQRISRKVTVANESELIGEAQDRSPRTEAFVKNFKPMDMGIIELPQGQHELSLRALEIPGEESIEFRLLVFRRVTGE